ncbi:hypothetical protein [Uliginosibacterium sp. H1]|uniref:hypothetical protein n=1 Tax=Uliginosibacterium sp. H1 TaxID=3114757 RepID=UPI002E1979D1|nr:hypothetical protein [Uliginosibacterium sp. H1]
MHKTALPLLSLLALSACSKLTLANYDKVQLGMSFDEVKALIGEPGECSDALMVRNCVWREGEASVSVSFVGNKATIFTADKLK